MVNRITAMIAAALIFLGAPATADSGATSGIREKSLEARAAEAVKAAEDANALKSTLLGRRFLHAARESFHAGKFQEALENAERSRAVSATEARKFRRDETPAAAPVTDAVFEAMTRLNAAKNSFPGDARVIAAEELMASSEFALDDGRYSEADALAKRAIEILSLLKRPAADTETTGTKPLDLNTAPISMLLGIPGMTEEMAANLGWFRSRIGPLRSVEELRYVPGFSSLFVALNRDRLAVEKRK